MTPTIHAAVDPAQPIDLTDVRSPASGSHPSVGREWAQTTDWTSHRKMLEHRCPHHGSQHVRLPLDHQREASAAVGFGLR